MGDGRHPERSQVRPTYNPTKRISQVFCRLRRFTRHDLLARVAESTARPRNSYALFNVSASIAKMVHRGLKAHIGAHGEAPLGLNYHAEMYFAKQGGLTNFEVRVRVPCCDFF